MHGEYKVPGGKLVVVDLDVSGEAITNFRLAGDFFLEPDELLDTINSAVDGMPADTDAAGVAAVVENVLSPGAALIGVTPEGIGTAVVRALSTSAAWAEYDWQLVHGEPQTELMHMALDEVLAEDVGAGRRPPTLRFWERNESAVILGSFQSVRNEVDMKRAGELGVRVARRVTGGGAMFVEPGAFITYSLYAPAELVRGMSVVESYPFLDGWVLQALAELGIDAYYQPINDIASPVGKIGGAAQKRFANGAVLHHVTMSYDMDADKMTQVLRIGREKLSDKGTTSAKKRVDPLRTQTGLSREDVTDRLIGTFRGLYGLTRSAVTDDEMRRARELVATKFGTDDWLYRVP
ncbi:lipoate--protein ligase family protein [Spelaeicoccus albus]|uniref:Lipoate-protein ligase A n=1 Tax=Spelaeicoccus albus TaxID=1280376 RepID=A0A7Z0D1Q1_9MICO|nr:biotin/lipoate A/B protein ligase family protein [Spelaeicoccus albus]NYI66535.1 lipoate-protein ligase A [Spelaeicoccus albus]